jgi:hypothetical protein
VGRVSEVVFTFKYSLYSHRVRGVYIPVTLTVGDRAAHLVVRVDCASTYCVLERPWAEYFGLMWDSGDLIHIGTAVGDSRPTCMSLACRWIASAGKRP